LTDYVLKSFTLSGGSLAELLVTFKPAVAASPQGDAFPRVISVLISTLELLSV